MPSSAADSYHIFRNPLKAVFLRRPNRFVVFAGINGEEHKVHCPNPGRLHELLIPGAKLLLERAVPEYPEPDVSGKGIQRKSSNRSTRFTLAGVVYKDTVIPLISARANNAAGALIIPRLFPGHRIRREVKRGSSRFDFTAESEHGTIYIEVKACTLVEEGIAMFPDAPSLRAARHVEELAEINAEEGKTGMILFCIFNPSARQFIPSVHTDPHFSSILREKGMNGLRIKAVSFRCTPEGILSIHSPDIPVLLEPAQIAGENRGIYLLVLQFQDDEEIIVGALGTISLSRGYYVYTGSAKKNLSQRIARHKRKRKNLRWHIDYLTEHRGVYKDFPLLTRNDLECIIAEEIRGICDNPVPGFGSSDCTCQSHLFHFRSNPVENPAFLEILLLYRHREWLVH